MSKVGIKEVAQLAGVSVSTVSKVLNNYSSVSQKTKDKVLKVVEETGYIPNEVASSLSLKSNNRIALYICINDKFQQIDEINMLYLLGAFDQADEDNLSLITVFSNSLRDYSKEEYAKYFQSISCDNIVIFGLNKEDEKLLYFLEDPGFNFVVVDAGVVNEHTSCVYIDHTLGQYEVAKTIVREKEKVLYITGKTNGYVTEMRLEGIKKLQKELDLDLTIVDGEFSEKKASAIVANLDCHYDSIVCASDLMAIGVIKALKDTDTKVCGFDGIRLMGYVANDIYTCKQDFYQIGRATIKAVRELKDSNEGKEVILPHSVGKIS